MIRAFILVLLLAGCSEGERVNYDKWVCTKVGTFIDEEGIIAGGVYMETPTKKVGCVQWSRMEYKQ